jgi:L-alanine-DL-glutamate epimerase-like enolase superfamily enzyme
MLITDVRAHHIRIPYDAGVASFKQGASAIAALDIVLVEVSTDAGLTGWGDAWGYVCPRSTATAVDEMIAPQARGHEAPDAAGIPSFMERIQRNLHPVRPVWHNDVRDLRSRHRLMGSRGAREGLTPPSAAR